jgi:hypothetical protein
MAQSPIHQKHAPGAALGRETIWPRVRERLNQWFTIAEIKAGDKINGRTIASFLQTLIAAGHMERRDGEGQAVEYRLNRDLGVHVPRYNRKGEKVSQGSGVDNMWRTMRMSRDFDPDELVLLSTTDSVSVDIKTAQAYCSKLLKAGYLKVLQKAQPLERKRARYQLIRDTGPLAPKIQRIKRVWDQNLGTYAQEVGR